MRRGVTSVSNSGSCYILHIEECVVIHMQSAPKFKVISKWEDEMGNEFLNEQLRSC